MRVFSWFQFWLKAYQRIRRVPVIPEWRLKNARRQWRRSFRKKRAEYEQEYCRTLGVRAAMERSELNKERRQLQELIRVLTTVHATRDYKGLAGLMLQCTVSLDAHAMMNGIPPGDNSLMPCLARQLAHYVERELRSMNLWAVPLKRDELRPPSSTYRRCGVNLR